MAEKNKLAQIPSQQMPERQSNLLSQLWDEATGAFARYGRRSGAQRDASLALLNQAVDPNTDPLTGAGMKALGLAGLITHPLAFFPTGDEWRERLANAGNTSRLGQSVGGMLGDLPSLIDPHLLAGGGALAMAPLVGKMAGKVDDVADAGRVSGMANDAPRKFFRGTNGSAQRINEPFSEAKGLTFVARKPESARMYGNNIEEITANPGAKILDDEMPEFWRLIGRRRPPNGFVGSARGGTIEVVNEAIRKARDAGYDAVSFSSDADIGTVLINESAFTRGTASP